MRQPIDSSLHTLIETTPDAIWIVDATGRTRYVNPRLARLLGFEREEMLERPIVDYLAPTMQNEVHAQLRLAQHERVASRFECCFLASDGAEVWTIISMSPLPGEYRDGILCMLTDITRYKHAELEMAQQQQTLHRLADELTHTEDRERRQLATALHDDICQPLALAEMKLDALQAMAGTETMRSQLATVTELIEQAIHAGRSLTFELSPPILYEVGLAAALDWLAEHFQRVHGLTVSVHADEAPGLPEDMRAFFFRAVRELLTNVVKHARARHATISVRQQDGQAVASVTDDGTGFEVAQAQTRKVGGFGLFSLRERLHHLGGRLAILSQPAQGSCISIAIPLTQESDTDERTHLTG